MKKVRATAVGLVVIALALGLPARARPHEVGRIAAPDVAVEPG